MSQSSDTEHVSNEDSAMEREDIGGDATGEQDENKKQLSAEERERQQVQSELQSLFVRVAPENGSKRFDAWTTVLEVAEKAVLREPGVFDLARAAFEQFLSEFPFCFGYWNKLAELTAHHGSNSKANLDGELAAGGNAAAVFDVFEKAVRALPTSVELWLFYVAFAEREWRETIALVDSVEECESRTRALFERAFTCCSLEPKVDKLWIRYLDFEMEHKRFSNAVKLIDRVLHTPCSFARDAFERFQRLIAAHLPQDLLSATEYETLEQEIRMQLAETAASQQDESDTSDVKVEVGGNDERFLELARARCIEQRRVRFEKSRCEYERRSTYETALRRAFFHVKPLESSQITAWRAYLDFELADSTDASPSNTCKHERIVHLFERCCVATAMYDQFWCDYLDYIYTHLLEDSQCDPSWLAQCACLRPLYDASNGAQTPSADGLFTSSGNKFETLKSLAKQQLNAALNTAQCDSHLVVLLRCVCERALVHVGHRPFVYVRIAELLERLSSVTHACTMLQTAVSQAFQDNVAVRLALIDTLRRAAQNEAADEQFERILSSEASLKTFVFPLEVRSAVALKYARYLLLDGRLDRSVDVLRNAIDSDPASVRLRYALVDSQLRAVPLGLTGKQRDAALHNVHATFSQASLSTQLNAEAKLDLAARHVELCESLCSDTSLIDRVRATLKLLQRENNVRRADRSNSKSSNNDEPSAAKRPRLASDESKKQQQQLTTAHWNAATAPASWDPSAVASYYGSYGYPSYAYGAPYPTAVPTGSAAPPWPSAPASAYGSYPPS